MGKCHCREMKESSVLLLPAPPLTATHPFSPPSPQQTFHPFPESLLNAVKEKETGHQRFTPFLLGQDLQR
jgi:hypothetical protein